MSDFFVTLSPGILEKELLEMVKRDAVASLFPMVDVLEEQNVMITLVSPMQQTVTKEHGL